MIVNSSKGLLQRMVVLRSRVANYAKTAAEEQKAFWAKNDKLKRPMSPHLTIYRLPLPANLSIMHRGTGAAMTGMLFGFGLGSFFWGGKFEKVYEYLRDNVHPHVLLTAKVIIAFPFCYHAMNGIRHLLWDTGRGLKLPLIYKTGYTILALSFLFSFALATI